MIYLVIIIFKLMSSKISHKYIELGFNCKIALRAGVKNVSTYIERA